MKKLPPLLARRIIADLRSGDERADSDYPGLRVRRTNVTRMFFYRYRAHEGVLREIRLGEFGPMTLAEARKALGRLKLERERGVDPQLKNSRRAPTRGGSVKPRSWPATPSKNSSKTTLRKN